MSGDVGLHRWRLRFEQSGSHHIARALRDGAVSVFGPLPLRRHATVPFDFHHRVSRWPKGHLFQTPPFCKRNPAPGDVAHVVPRVHAPLAGIAQGEGCDTKSHERSECENSGVVFNPVATPPGTPAMNCSKRGEKGTKGNPIQAGEPGRGEGRTGERERTSMRSAVTAGRRNLGRCGDDGTIGPGFPLYSGANTGSPAHRRHPPRPHLRHAERGNPDEVCRATGSKPTVREAEPFGGAGMVRDAKAGSRKARGNGRSKRPHNPPDRACKSRGYPARKGADADRVRRP